MHCGMHRTPASFASRNAAQFFMRLLAGVCYLPPGSATPCENCIYQDCLDDQDDLTTRVRGGGAGRGGSWMESEAKRATRPTPCEHFEGRAKWSKVLAVALPPTSSCRSVPRRYLQHALYLQHAPSPRPACQCVHAWRCLVRNRQARCETCVVHSDREQDAVCSSGI